MGDGKLQSNNKFWLANKNQSTFFDPTIPEIAYIIKGIFAL